MDITGGQRCDLINKDGRFYGWNGDEWVQVALEITDKAPVVMTDAAAYSLLAENSGLLHIIPNMTQNSAFSLPPAAVGLEFPFQYGGAADDAHDHTFDAGADANFFIGGVAFADTDAGDAADEINAGVYSDGDSNSILTVNNIAAGTLFTVTCDGTNWYINGVVFSDTVPAFSDQA